MSGPRAQIQVDETLLSAGAAAVSNTTCTCQQAWVVTSGHTGDHIWPHLPQSCCVPDQQHGSCIDLLSFAALQTKFPLLLLASGCLCRVGLTGCELLMKGDKEHDQQLQQLMQDPNFTTAGKIRSDQIRSDQPAPNFHQLDHQKHHNGGVPGRALMYHCYVDAAKSSMHHCVCYQRNAASYCMSPASVTCDVGCCTLMQFPRIFTRDYKRHIRKFQYLGLYGLPAPGTASAGSGSQQGIKDHSGPQRQMDSLSRLLMAFQ